MTRSRRPNWRGIKIHRSYTVDEAARKLGVAKGTVRRWLKTGLPAIADHKPTLILGAEFAEFRARRKKSGHKCQLHECYCVKCRMPRHAAGDMAEYMPITATSGNLRAICPNCSTLMHRRIALTRLRALKGILDVSMPQGFEHLMDSPKPSPNDNHEEEPAHHA